jgi:uncharacterized membrane protein YesL
MDLLSLSVHVVNFIAPALAVAAWITLIYPLVWRQEQAWKAWKKKFVLNSLAGCAMLLLGLLLSGQDGKMISYTAMVLAIASSQWLLSREKSA